MQLSTNHPYIHYNTYPSIVILALFKWQLVALHSKVGHLYSAAKGGGTNRYYTNDINGLILGLSYKQDIQGTAHCKSHVTPVLIKAQATTTNELLMSLYSDVESLLTHCYPVNIVKASVSARVNEANIIHFTYPVCIIIALQVNL